jgi:hypothetical protein
LAGNVVSRSLGILHWMAISCGVVFAATSMIESRVDERRRPSRSRPVNLLVYLMIVLTLVGMSSPSASKMQALKPADGD